MEYLVYVKIIVGIFLGKLLGEDNLKDIFDLVVMFFNVYQFYKFFVGEVVFFFFYLLKMMGGKFLVFDQLVYFIYMGGCIFWQIFQYIQFIFKMVDCDDDLVKIVVDIW